MDEIDVWETARSLIEQHADNAELAATKQRDAMVQRGDWVGVMVWHRVMQAISQLRKTPSAKRGGTQ